ncbi:MAG: transporter [Phycisphaerales bacterium]|nr:transporter [Phycisphaerales bacterium]
MRIQKLIITSAICALAPISIAQESALSLAATQPAKGRITWREQARFEKYELGNEEIDQFTIDTRLTYGVSKDIALTLNVPTVLRDRENGIDDQNGLGDATLSLKWRFWQHDPGPIDTNRLALIGGVRMPTGTDGLSSDGWDPMVGLIFTRVSGRHGINAAATYLLSTDGLASPISAGTGTDDLLTLETSYLYRLAPSEYTSETEASWYFTVESFVDYETNGDLAWRVAPGVLYEARRFTVELSPIVPIVNDIDHRAELDWGVALGVRVLF